MLFTNLTNTDHNLLIFREDLEALEHELLRRQSQSRSSEIKRMKDTHLQEFLDAEAAWKEKTEALQAKVWSTKAQFTELFTFYGVVKNRLCLSNCTERYLDMLCLSYPGHTYAKDAIVRQIGGV